MLNFIENIEINNFKSIQECKIRNCKRINLFIGKPNVGKSNILEALSLFTLPYLKDNSSKKLTTLIRVENEPELFYNGNISLDARISTNLGSCKLYYNPKEGLKFILNYNSDSFSLNVDEKLNVKNGSNHKDFESPIKKYSYQPNVSFKKSHSKYLIPPFGSNLLSVILEYPDIKNDIVELFQENRLRVAFDKSSQSIKIIQSEGDTIFLVRYNSIADTLQRVIFFKTAIKSASNSILLFEEPEAHSFPPYMVHITQEMIYKTDNQYFLTTQSPFILTNLLEHGRSELAVYIVSYKRNQTKVKKLEQEELDEIYQNGVDLFTNYESFV